MIPEIFLLVLVFVGWALTLRATSEPDDLALVELTVEVRGTLRCRASRRPRRTCRDRRRAQRSVWLEDAAVPAILETLSDEDALVRQRMVRLLGYAGDKSPEVLPALTRALSDEDASVRGEAAWCFRRHVRSPVSVPPGCQTCDSPVTIVDASSEFDALVAGLRDGDSRVRRHLAVAIGNMGVRAGPAVPELTRLLADDDVGVRRMAARAIGFVGPAARVGARRSPRRLRSRRPGRQVFRTRGRCRDRSERPSSPIRVAAGRVGRGMGSTFPRRARGGAASRVAESLPVDLASTSLL